MPAPGQPAIPESELVPPPRQAPRWYSGQTDDPVMFGASSGPGVAPPGTPRAARTPAGPRLDTNPGAYVIAPERGLHAELVNLASMPDGTQVPFQQAAKTWRADPQPWDTGVYAGFVPPPQPEPGDPL